MEEKQMMKMVTKKTWKEFRKTGLLWWINAQLHMFGWSIVVETKEYPGTEIKQYTCFPARVKFRGFSEKNNTEGYKKVTEFMKNNVNELEEEANN